MTNFDKVNEFHTAFNLPIITSPSVPSLERVRLRTKIVTEEYKELKSEVDPHLESVGVEEINLGTLAKEIADLLYVCYGMATEFGIDADKAFDAVHRSNMSKLDENGKPIYREDGKVIKSSLYRPPNMNDALNIGVENK